MSWLTFESGSVPSIDGMTGTLLKNLHLEKSVAESVRRGDLPGLWHASRAFEYPLVVSEHPPYRKRVLDIGCNPQFPLSLRMDTVEHWCMHHTSYDTEYLGMALLWGIGWVPFHDWFKRNEKVLSLVSGFPDRWPIASSSFDLIYNISVMEHVPPEHLMAWMGGIWDALSVGGVHVFTCDYVSAKPLGWGVEYVLHNHSLWDFFGPRDDWRLISGNTREIPWHPDYENRGKGTPAFGPWDAADNQDLSVYYFAVEKV